MHFRSEPRLLLYYNRAVTIRKDDLYATRASEKVQERTNELLATAEIIYTEN